VDPQARKQVLLTRIASERIALRKDVQQVQQAAHLPRLLRAAVGSALDRSLFGTGTTSPGDWAGKVLSLLRRYRLAAALLAGVAPVVGGRSGWRRIVRLGALAAAAWFGWRAVQRRDH
jgi:hypothetical protein